jgi:hypothetical protein
MWHRDTKCARAVGKMASIDLINAGLPQTFNLYKKKHAVFAKRNKPRHACSPEKANRRFGGPYNIHLQGKK